MHNGSGAAPVLRGWEGPTSSSEGGSSTSEVQPPKSFYLVPSWFHPKCLFSLVLPIPTSFSRSSSFCQSPDSPRPLSYPPMLSSDVGLASPTLSKRASHHFHLNIFPLAPSFEESWLLGSAVTTPIKQLTIEQKPSESFIPVKRKLRFVVKTEELAMPILRSF